MPSPLYLIYLEWPEKCFRISTDDLRYLRTLVPKGSRVVRVRDDTGFMRALPRATHAIVWRFRREWFARASRLRVLATPAAGQELVPTAGPPGVTIHFGHYHGAIMAESVAGFMLAWSRGFFAVRYAPPRVAAWPRTWLSERCAEVAGTTAVIAGYGHAGRAIGRQLAALGVTVYGITRHGIFAGDRHLAGVTRARLLKKADWFVLALPSTTGTDNFLGAALLKQLPRRCVVINVGRGNAIDERALLAALRAHRLAGAYLDVCKREPTLNPDGRRQPSMAVDDSGLPPNCIVMPHASAFSPLYLRRCFKELKDDWCL